MAAAPDKPQKAKVARSKTHLDATKADPPKAVLKAMNTLEKLYRKGGKLGAKYPRYQRSSKAQKQPSTWFKNERFKNKDSAHKVRQFADVMHGGFSREDLDGLIELCKEHQRPLGFSFVVKLLTVPEKEERHQFAERMIREGWSMLRVNQELLAKFGRRREGGKKRRLPGDVAGLLTQLDRMALNWTKWYARAVEEAKGEEAPLQLLPTDIQEQVRHLERKATRLRGRIAIELGFSSKKEKNPSTKGPPKK